MRYYNGCPDSELQALIDETARLRAEMLRLNPKAHCTYFPAEEMYLISDDFRTIGPEFKNQNVALRWAIREFSQPK